MTDPNDGDYEILAAELSAVVIVRERRHMLGPDQHDVYHAATDQYIVDHFVTVDIEGVDSVYREVIFKKGIWEMKATFIDIDPKANTVTYEVDWKVE